ncbi:MAG: Nramp family divalent metal transporter [Coriobacteriia bacterium]|nr:Nramp family divalent metal transporter [Coriobacteriia bacterium]MDI6843244.1 Nramp family divalent metal transporter [Anaerosomatales bacterium]
MAASDLKKRTSLLAVLGVIGPGIIAASAGNDSGGISTYSVAGARYGYTMLWMMLAMTPSFAIVQEMAGRMGAVTGKGFAALIRERFGLRPTFVAMLLLLTSNAATTVAEFAGIAAAMELFGVSRLISVPIAALAVWMLVTRGSYRNVEKVLLALSSVFVSYVLAAFLARPDWGEVARSFVTPRIVPTQAFIALAIGLTGTTIAPWMQFLVQSNIVDKGTTIKEWALARWDVIVGALSANLVACFIIITTGTVLHPAGITIQDAGEAARALAPLAGPYAELLFSVGLLSASILSAAVLPLTASYAICEAFGWEAGLDRTWNEAPAFNGLYTFVIFAAAAVILVPRLDLIAIMLLSQVVNGVMLPFLLIFMMVIINDRRVMGRHVNSRLNNVLGWTTIVVVIALTVALLAMTALGIG